MDVRFINPLVKSICNTFETMCSLPITLGNPELKANHDQTADVAAIIGLSGDAVGTVVLNFSFDTASGVAGRFVGREMSTEDPDFADAMGELATVVAGGASTQLQGLALSVSLPNVIVGQHQNITTSMRPHRILIPCGTEVGDFFVEVGMVLAEDPVPAGTGETSPGVNP